MQDAHRTFQCMLYVFFPNLLMYYLQSEKTFFTINFVHSFLTRELRACARASCRYAVENGARSLDWSIAVNFFSILGF